MKNLLCLLLCAFAGDVLVAGSRPLHDLQQDFVDTRFGMFIHFNMPTYVDQDWPDPDASPELFNPIRTGPIRTPPRSCSTPRSSTAASGRAPRGRRG